MPFFTYNRDIPDSGNNPSVDQPKMERNTNNTDDILNIDHFSFNLNQGGLHKQVNMFNQSSPPLQGDLVLYSNTSNGQSTLWAKNSFQDLPIFTGAANTTVNRGFTSVFAGVFLQWGRVSGSHGSDNHFNSGDSGTVTFSSSGGRAFPTNCFMVIANPLYNSDTGSAPSSEATIAVDIFTLSKTQFKWTFLTNSSQYTNFMWYAIGN